MFHAITPVLLTFNEMPNIGRTLSHLDWADEIVVVDSGSNDGTLDVLRQNPKVRVYERKFDTHAGQWRYAITETSISTPWILRLDADYQISPELIREISLLDPAVRISAYRISFGYAIYGRVLRASLYPPTPSSFARITLELSMAATQKSGRLMVWCRTLAGSLFTMIESLSLTGLLRRHDMDHANCHTY